MTCNTRDFPAAILKPLGLTAQTPDAFLVDQWWLSPAHASRILDDIVRAAANPPLTRTTMLDRLQAQLPEFSALARGPQGE